MALVLLLASRAAHLLALVAGESDFLVAVDRAVRLLLVGMLVALSRKVWLIRSGDDVHAHVFCGWQLGPFVFFLHLFFFKVVLLRLQLDHFCLGRVILFLDAGCSHLQGIHDWIWIFFLMFETSWVWSFERLACSILRFFLRLMFLISRNRLIRLDVIFRRSISSNFFRRCLICSWLLLLL